jgi:hypothetical protein
MESSASDKLFVLATMRASLALVIIILLQVAMQLRARCCSCRIREEDLGGGQLDVVSP